MEDPLFPLSLGPVAVAGHYYGWRTGLSPCLPVNGQCASATGYHPADELGTTGVQHGQQPHLEPSKDRLRSSGPILVVWWTAP